MTKQDRAEILRLWRLLVSIPKIKSIFGVSTSELLAIVKEQQC